MVAQTQVRVIKIKVDTQGDASLRKIASGMGRINTNTRSAAKSLGFLSSGLKAAIAGFGVREIIRSADSFQLLKDRIKVFTGTGEEANKVFTKLVAAARFTKTSVDALAQSYNRIALATQELGLSNDSIIGTTIALQQTFRLSGATIAEAAAATIQLSQGLSSGQLRGQELRSVLEQNAVAANILSKEIGISRGQLIKFAESGKITSEVVLKALAKNVDELNRQAGKLATTFEQAATIGLDAFRVELARLNKDFGIASKFEKAIIFAIDNMGALAAAVGTLVAGGLFLKLATAIKAAGGAMLFLTSTTAPWIALVGATAAGVGYLTKKFIDNKRAHEEEINTVKTGIPYYQEKIKQQEALLKNEGRISLLRGQSGGASRDSVTAPIKAQLAADQKQLAELQRLQRNGFDFVPGFEKKQSPEEVAKQAADALKRQRVEVQRSLNPFQELNAQLKVGSITLEQYGLAVRKIKIAELTKKLDEGKITQFDFNREVEKLNKKLGTQAGKFKSLNAEFTKGALTLEEYRVKIAELQKQDLNKQFEEGKISVDQYNESIKKINLSLEETNTVSAGVKKGLEETAKSAGDIASNISTGIQNTFRGLEDVIVEFTKTGQFEFKKFTEAVLEDLTRILIRAQIIAPLANGLLGAFGGSGGLPSGSQVLPASTTGFGTTAANGQALSMGNVIPFASGGIVNNPTLFGMSGGRQGLMGEAGPEAIIPLSRGRDGRLGVSGSGSNVVVNVINNSGNDVEQKESKGPNGEKIIDIMVMNSVKKGISNGSLDSSFSETFGLRRQGR